MLASGLHIGPTPATLFPDLSQCLVVGGGWGLLLLAAPETLTGGFNQDPDVICLSNEMCIYDLHISNTKSA